MVEIPFNPFQNYIPLTTTRGQKKAIIKCMIIKWWIDMKISSKQNEQGLKTSICECARASRESSESY